MGAYEYFMQIEFGGVRSFDQILQAENGQKLTNINQHIWVIIDIDEK